MVSMHFLQYMHLPEEITMFRFMNATANISRQGGRNVGGKPARLPAAKEGFFDWSPEDEEPEGDMDFESSLRGDDLPQ